MEIDIYFTAALNYLIVSGSIFYFGLYLSPKSNPEEKKI